MSAFRAALRISRRNAWRSKRRSALILTMIALPVLIATFVASAAFDSTIDDHSGVPLGQADAVVSGSPDLAQAAEDESGDAPPKARPFTAAEVIEMFGPGTRAVQMDQGFIRYLTPQGFRSDMVNQADLRDPLFRGTYRLLDGRLPAAPGEIVVNTVMNQGPSSAPGIGQTFFAGRQRVPLRVVGDVLMPLGWPPDFVGFPGSLPVGILDDAGPGGTTFWMVDTPKPVSRAEARRLAARGADVVSPAAPDESQQVVTSSDNSVDLEPVPWIAMMLLEVVLLAGPAFAVGQRRRSREFALIGAQGGSPRQLKRIALADGLLFGVCASMIGAVLGIGVAALVKPSLAVGSDSLEESISVPWTVVAIIMAMGVAAGLLASLAPAQRASRTDMIAVLTGRRTPGRDRAGRPVLGLVLIVAGLTGTAVGARYSVAWIASAALLTQLGLLAVLPWLIAQAGRLAGVLPFSLRFAVRDAARNRGRTVPAVAAVMAAVTLFTALGVASRSNLSAPPVFGFDYPQGPPGALWIRGQELGPELWDRVRAQVHAALPAGAPVIEAKALVTSSSELFLVDVPPRDPDHPESTTGIETVDPSGNGGLLVGDERLLRYVLGREDSSAASALRAGKAVALNPGDVRNGKVHIGLTTSDSDINDAELTLPAVSVRATGQGWARVVISPETAKKQGYATDTALLVVDPASYRVVPAAARRLLSDVGQMSPQVTGRLEVPQPPDDRPILLTLGAAAAVLVLGMTFVSTGLAAAEAKPDLAVMSAVGAAPRMRRRVKAGQALVIALAGAVIGVLAGLVAGVAAGWPRPHARASRPLFGADGLPLTPQPATPVIIVPWSLIALLVVGLPLLAALVCGVFTRSRLPAPRRRPA
ncbi:hypothetical protein Psi02_39770 [Planotetraspora silvatica]|uniref:ABC3 transporter permease C-terminal domain-containing protein n=1 Tax=Planotetraspora silvatica TaxID=234614 RepID=A0A8J3XSQ3_9ACTN|nr:FtsX-like permease family protein [Planotetraspora silvatica]GII47553.1 hypothetical protein Psi02_39770 [Planotetraspora silvatica]